MSNHNIPFNPLELNEKCSNPEAENLFKSATLEPTNPKHTAYLEAKGASG